MSTLTLALENILKVCVGGGGEESLGEVAIFAPSSHASVIMRHAFH